MYIKVMRKNADSSTKEVQREWVIGKEKENDKTFYALDSWLRYGAIISNRIENGLLNRWITVEEGFAGTGGNDEFLRETAETGMKFVLADRTIDLELFDTIHNADRDAIGQMMCHLLERKQEPHRLSPFPRPYVRVLNLVYGHSPHFHCQPA
jgi:hypothetical protein